MAREKLLVDRAQILSGLALFYFDVDSGLSLHRRILPNDLLCTDALRSHVNSRRCTNWHQCLVLSLSIWLKLRCSLPLALILSVLLDILFGREAPFVEEQAPHSIGQTIQSS